MTFRTRCGNKFIMNELIVKPFRGLLYNTQKIDDISRCVCPPYDVISSVRTYYERDPFNAIRLELPMPQPALDPYSTARNTLDQWTAEQVLVPDKNETIYVYEQEFAVDGSVYQRRGFIGLAKLDMSRILIHEATKKKAKEDRKRLITSTKTFTSIVFMLYQDMEQTIEGLLTGSDKEEMYDFIDEQSVTNRFYRMKDSKEIEALSRLMSDRYLYVADGHHRLDVSSQLQIPYIPFYMTNMYAPGIVILPYHRTVKFARSRSLEELFLAMKGTVIIEKYPVDSVDSIMAALRDISLAVGPQFIMYGKEDKAHFYMLKEKAPIPVKDAASDALKRLKVNILHNGIVKQLLSIEDEEISFTQDAAGAIATIQQGASDLIFLLPPTGVEEVKRIADEGLYMPPKSTFFYPKILTGLVFHRYA